MSFSVLPSELQISIFEDLDNTDLKAVRAVCSRFRSNATPRLFRSMVVCLRYKGLSALERVAESELLRGYVVEVVLDASRYSPTVAKNRGVYEMRERHYENLRDGTSWTRQLRWRRYKDLCDDQRDMIEDFVYLHTLAKAFSRMPNLQRIIWSSDAHFIPLEKKSNRDLVPPLLEYMSPESHDGLHHLIGAIHCEQITQIKEFIIDPDWIPEVYDDCQKPLFSLDAFQFPSPSNVEAGRFFFKNLQKIHLDISLRHVERDTDAMLKNMKLLLSDSQQLRDLRLCLKPWQNNAGETYINLPVMQNSTFTLIGLDSTWPNLQSLHLGGIYADEAQFSDLIDRHQHTLRSVCFEHCGINEDGGKWAKVVQKVVCSTTIPDFVLIYNNELGVSVDTAAGTRTCRFDGKVAVDAYGRRCFYAHEWGPEEKYAWMAGRW